jgi:hypothetical protein
LAWILLAVALAVVAAKYARVGHAKIRGQALQKLAELRDGSPRGTAASLVFIPRSTTELAVPVSGGQSVGGTGAVNVIPIVRPGTREVRKFSIKVLQANVNWAHAAIASGGFYDLEPSVSINPEKLAPLQRKFTQCGEIAVTGLPDAVNGQWWFGWLERDSNLTYGSMVDGKHTVASYRVIPEPPAPGRKPGDWMAVKGRTALER